MMNGLAFTIVKLMMVAALGGGPAVCPCLAGAQRCAAMGMRAQAPQPEKPKCSHCKATSQKQDKPDKAPCKTCKSEASADKAPGNGAVANHVPQLAIVMELPLPESMQWMDVLRAVRPAPDLAPPPLLNDLVHTSCQLTV